MSCYEWERGEFKIPTKEWANFKKKLRSTYNEWASTQGAKKKDLLNNRDNEINFGETLDYQEFQITFNDKEKTASWTVDENNHSCDCARRHEITNTLFVLLNKMPWTEKTGGVIWGNDEYNRDSSHISGGGNYIKDVWGNKKCSFVKFLVGSKYV